MATSTKQVVSQNNTVTLSISRFKNMFLAQPPTISVMVRGRHGIGKSQAIYQVARDLRSNFYHEIVNCKKFTMAARDEKSVQSALKTFWDKNGENPTYKNYKPSSDFPMGLWHYDMGLPVIERRLSTMQDGDMSGIPTIRKRGDDGYIGGTVFHVTEFVRLCSEFPAFLFLDELNRAPTKALEQATFQLSDSRCYNGVALHPESRFATAINIGAAYDTIKLDHASISRYSVVDLAPTHEEWLDYAKASGHHPLMILFHTGNKVFLDPAENYHNTAKQQDRRAWTQLDAALQFAGLYDRPREAVFSDIVQGRVGEAAGAAFVEHVRKQTLDISPMDVLKDWDKCKKKMEELAEGASDVYKHFCLQLFTKMKLHFESYKATDKLTDKEIRNFIKFGLSLPYEQGQAIYGLLAFNPELQNRASEMPEMQEVFARLTPVMQMKKDAELAAKKAAAAAK